MWRNLSEGRVRALLTAVGVALGTGMIVASSVARDGLSQSISTPENDQNVFQWVVDNFYIGLQIAGGVVLVSAGFLIFNAFAMAVTQRRQQIGVMRSLGMTQRQVLRLVLLEAAVLSGIGSLLGIVLGPFIGNGILTIMNQWGMATESGSITLSAIGMALLMGMGITLLSVWIPARRAAQVSPMVALRAGEMLNAKGQTGTGHKEKMQIFAGAVLAIGALGYALLARPGAWAEPQLNLQIGFLLTAVWFGGWLLLLPLILLSASVGGQRPLTRLFGTTGRLMADNLGRDRGRVLLTLLTFVVALTMIVSITGMLTFNNEVLFSYVAADTLAQEGWGIYPFDQTLGAAAVTDLEPSDVNLPPALEPEVREIAGDRAIVGRQYLVMAPEISAMFPGFPSLITELEPLLAPGGYNFSEGSWETALPILQNGCGLLLTPDAMGRGDYAVGQTVRLTGVAFPIDCTIAGVGRGGLYPVAFITMDAAEAFGVANPQLLTILPQAGIDRAQLEADLQAVVAQYGDKAWLIPMQDSHEALNESARAGTVLLNGMLLIAIVAAALGVVNTTMMSVTDRQKELGLLRAIGGTRRQVTAVVIGEAALLGVVGGVVGLLAGLGSVLIFVFAYGGQSFGVVDLPLWEASFQAMRPALTTGILGLISAPLISAGAAWLPVRSLLKGSTIDTLQPRRQPLNPSSRSSRLFNWGTIRTRFAVGTAVLLFLTLWGLITFVSNHARGYMDDLASETVEAMVGWNVRLAETSLADDATSLSLEMLPTSQFDAGMMLRMESLIDGMTDNGMTDFYIINQDKMVLMSSDPRDAGTVKDDVALPASLTTAVADTDAAREMSTIAPIQNEAGQTIGAISLTMRLDWIDDFLAELQRALWLVGGLILLVGVALSWAVATPFVRATRALSSGAVATGAGAFQPIPQPPSNWITRHTSLKTRLTAVLIGILIFMVGSLQLLTIPIEQRRLEETLQEVMLTGAEWMGQVFTDFGYGMGDVRLADLLDPDRLTSTDGSTPSNLPSAGDMQELAELMQNEYVAYAAIADEEGLVQFANRLNMVGDELGTSAATILTETEWGDEPLWAIATPMRDADGVQVGTLHVGVRLTAIDEFIAESRTLFWLTGVIAVLAGIILAQIIGGAVTAPVNQLATGTRKIGRGDLSVQFQVHSKDELAQLANAYNEMVAGLREREWLRDMFGRFVSREVAEAIRTGQVKLEGETRVVSILFCDIRGFTAHSEKSTPAEIVSLLNEYLPIVVDAAQKHEGTVNKFGGDSTLIIYGAPKQSQESAYQAVLTALEMQRNLDDLNTTLAQRGEEPIRIGVGINTGTVLAGAVGPPERQEYTVIGDTVNLASRIEALNKEYPQHGILISGQTYDALGARRAEFAFTDLGDIQIRGKLEAVRVWAVVQSQSVNE